MNIHVDFNSIKDAIESFTNTSEKMKKSVDSDLTNAMKFSSMWQSEAVGKYNELLDYISKDIKVEYIRIEYCAEELMYMIEQRNAIDVSELDNIC